VSAGRVVAKFDSATAMLRALAGFLHGRDFPMLGGRAQAEPLAAGLLGLVNRLPEGLREQLYIYSGWSEATPPAKLAPVRSEALAGWVAGHYPRRRYPAVMVGSSNGAMVHLGAALGIPWLPQTLLLPVRQRGVHPDEPADDLEAMAGPARVLLAANPDLVLHHMHDANQDRLMIQRMTYFRVKRLRLGAAYQQFLADTLAPGGIIFLVECTLSWPTTRVGERHVFQQGALGGATVSEAHRGSERVADYLRRYGSHRRRWDPPPPDGDRPEAEWGFEPALGEDVERFAADRGYRVRRISFEQPEDLSPLVADLYRDWYRRRGLPAERLLVESFILLEPWWALATGSVPFWLVFNTEPSLATIHRYLDTAGSFDEIRLSLFSHGVESVGLPAIGQWRTILERAGKLGSFLGVDEHAFPRDFATLVRYHQALARVRKRYPMPRPLALEEVDAFLHRQGGQYAVDWK
jgi:hypothetical protein